MDTHPRTTSKHKHHEARRLADEQSSRQAKEVCMLHTIIGLNRLTSWFQPIYSVSSASIFGHEALARQTGAPAFSTIDLLFNAAHRHGLSARLDWQCRENSFREASRHGMADLDSHLFLNICPDSLVDPEYREGMTDALADTHGIAKERIVLEITERDMIDDYELFKQAIFHYRGRGYKIAIDDFGTGYGGLKLLSIIEPDFVKIDRHFISGIDQDAIKFNLVDSMVTACHRIGIKVIAEGIEDERHMRICADLGISLFQGYLFARPVPALLTEAQINVPALSSCDPTLQVRNREVDLIGDLARYIAPLRVNDSARAALERFRADPRILCLPVMEGECLRGIISRHRYMECAMVGPLGYGFNLNYYKRIDSIMDESFLAVEYTLSIEEVAQRIRLRDHDIVYDDVYVTCHGRYKGAVPVRDLLAAITEKSMRMARGCNPLSGLPGNEFIQREIGRMLSQSIHFDVCYLDLDNFKPFNDHYGFEAGDRVLKTVAVILEEVVAELEDNLRGFVGHIGGDDFIAIVSPRNSIEISKAIIARFTSVLDCFHTPEDLVRQGYVALDRHGERQCFALLSLSIGISSTEQHPFSSYAEISSLASEVKKKAKAIPGSSFYRDERRDTPRTETAPAEGMRALAINC